MTDFFFQMGLSNACFSLALAIVAMVVGAKARRPHLAHMLWLLVFIKIVTPPIVTIPIVTIPQQPETAVAINEHSRPGPPLANSREFDVDVQPAASLSSRIGSVVWNHGKEWLAPIWLLGSVVVFAWSMVRVCRFSRLLAAESEVAPQELQTAAVKIARRLRLNTIPTICTTSARLSPLVWWAGGKVRIVIPTALLDQMDAHEWQWILAHELAHVRRRDYLVRWLEWLACVCFWWNPVVWWARYNLRANEEICCDALVVSSLKPTPKSYANSLLTAIECLACPALRPPAIASEINSGGFLERRFKMIVSETPKRSNTRWLQACVLLCAMVVLPLGIASAQDYEAVGRRLRAAVKAGELTAEQARAMMGTLKKAGAAKKEQKPDRARAYLMKVRKELGAAVEAGRISRKDAAKRYEGAERKIRERMAAGREDDRARPHRVPRREEMGKVKERIWAGVKAGKITEEQAKQRWEKYLKRVRTEDASWKRERGERSITVEEYKRAEAKMRKMVEDGKVKPEDVERRLIEMRKMMAERGERKREGAAREGDIDWEGIKRRIEGAVKSGKMTRKEADAKYEEIKKRTAGWGERDSKRISREDFAKAAREIRKAIAEGKITEEQGRAKLAAIRKMIGERSERAARKDVDWEGIKRRIEGAVKSGKMTREEADAKYKAIKERMAGRREQ